MNKRTDFVRNVIQVMTYASKILLTRTFTSKIVVIFVTKIVVIVW